MITVDEDIYGVVKLAEIEAGSSHPDFQYRLKAMSALKDYDPDTAILILIGKLRDPKIGRISSPSSFARIQARDRSIGYSSSVRKISSEVTYNYLP